MGIRVNYNRSEGVMALDIEKKVDALIVAFPYLTGCPISQVPSMASEEKGSADDAAAKAFRKAFAQTLALGFPLGQRSR